MASSDGLASVEPWSLRQSFGVDSWLFPESKFSRDSDLLTIALHKSISTVQNHDTFLLPPDPLSPTAFLGSPAVSSPSPAPVSTLSNVSDPDSSFGTKRKRKGAPAGVAGKPPKRRSRPSKKSQTTFITADPANFRQMVQQVTGAKFISSSHNILVPIVKPEPHKRANELSPDRSVVPMLDSIDTSAFLSNHDQKNLAVAGENGFSGGGAGSWSSPITSIQSSAAELDNYPTLESWKVM
ncbi:PREDICTED: calmodulin-binding protein 25-like [Tarenaya hassleriana]|uniref:calmodulin-binding protein 25-like n=1 Tax=Tarenaya hassleriana TaxID=28532 RepID=UPI00053C75B9|nr:PREDICTED: calmodulin-binding protein 25-like [Tarenaya hassleriana]